MFSIALLTISCVNRHNFNNFAGFISKPLVLQMGCSPTGFVANASHASQHGVIVHCKRFATQQLQYDRPSAKTPKPCETISGPFKTNDNKNFQIIASCTLNGTQHALPSSRIATKYVPLLRHPISPINTVNFVLIAYTFIMFCAMFFCKLFLLLLERNGSLCLPQTI